MKKQKLTLWVDGDLIEGMKLLAVVEKRSLSIITEELYRGYFHRPPVSAKIMERQKIRDMMRARMEKKK
jgi:hypothetical protein